MPSEFDLIARYFTRPARQARLGVGDDAALVGLPAGHELAISTDMLVSGRHFFPDADPRWLGHKALAVNLSDLAAMGATPRWATLALALPEADAAWLQGFSEGFFALADQYAVELIGGDTTRGPLNLCITILGEVAAGQALRRDGARVGDDVWVSGELGSAALALRHLMGECVLADEEAAALLPRLHAPHPRVKLGLALRGLAHAAIDVSDGLLADLGHVLERSGVAAEIHLADVPCATPVRVRLTNAMGLRCLLAGGDDYELLFTASPAQRDAVGAAGQASGVAVTRIGQLQAGMGVRLLGPDGETVDVGLSGYDHFA